MDESTIRAVNVQKLIAENEELRKLLATVAVRLRGMRAELTALLMQIEEKLK